MAKGDAVNSQGRRQGAAADAPDRTKGEPPVGVRAAVADTEFMLESLHDETGLLAAEEFAGDTVSLRVSGDYLDCRFWYSADGENWRQLGDVVDGTALSPFVLGGFNYTGVYIGLYATSNGKASDNHADYEHFTYKPTGASRDDWYHRQIAKQRRN